MTRPSNFLCPSSSIGGLIIHYGITGQNQFIEITNLGLLKSVGQLSKTARPTDLLLPLTCSQFRTKFLNGLAALSLSGLLSTPHSLRHCRATHRFLSGVPITGIQLKGR